MKAWYAYIVAINKYTDDLQRYNWKPIIAETREEAERITPEYVNIGDEIKSNKETDKMLLDYFRNVPL